MVITSTSNPNVRRVRALQDRRSARRREERFVVEGRVLLEEALRAGSSPDCVFLTEAFAARPDVAELLEGLRAAGAKVILVGEHVLRAMSDTESPAGVLSVVTLPSLAPSDDAPLWLLLDGVSDPGNAGTILRSAAAADAGLVLVTPGSVDLFNPKVVRSAMGAHFRLPTLEAPWSEIPAIVGARRLLVADAHEGESHDRVDWLRPGVLVLGEEAHGVGHEASRMASGRVTISMRRATESLNVAMAATVILFEAARQRLRAGSTPGS